MIIAPRPLLLAIALVLVGCQSLRDMRQSAWEADTALADGSVLRYHISKDGRDYSGSASLLDGAGNRIATAPLIDPVYEQQVFSATVDLGEGPRPVRIVYTGHGDDELAGWICARDEIHDADLLFRKR